MTNKSSYYCVAMGIFGYIFGVVYCCTLILIPVGIYCFIGAKKYMDCSALTDSQLTQQKKALVGYAVFFGIFAFPLGLLAIAPAYYASSNQISVTDVGTSSVAQPGEVETQTTERAESVNPLSDDETLEKLKHLYEEGLITKEELNRATEEVKNKQNPQ